MHIAHCSGRVELRGEALCHTRDNLVVTFAANKLTNTEGFFGTSNPFLKIHRQVCWAVLVAGAWWCCDGAVKCSCGTRA